MSPTPWPFSLGLFKLVDTMCPNTLIRTHGLIWIRAFCPLSLPYLLRDLTGQIPSIFGHPSQCSQSLLHAPCILSGASLLLIEAPTLKKVSSAFLWLLYEGPGFIAPRSLTPWGQAGQYVKQRLGPQVQVMSRPCHDLAVSQAVLHLFLYLANIY